MKNIDWLLDELKVYFASDATGHDYWHTMRVYKTALKLGQEEGGNLRIIQAAALLHDVADWKLDEDKQALGQKKMRDWLDALAYTDDERQAVFAIIENMSYKGGTNNHKTLSLEGQVVQDADRLDAIGAIGIARTFAYGGAKGRPMHDPDMKPADFQDFEAYKKHQGATVNHFYEKLFKLKDLMNTESGRKMAESRDAFMHAYLDQFYGEWDGVL